MNYDSAKDQDSWINMRLVVKLLNEQCAKEKRSRYKGGTITTGANNLILIKLSWAGSATESSQVEVIGGEVEVI